MGKRILLILISLFVFAGSAFAYSYPRWFTMPVSVYIPKQEEYAPVAAAFKLWQTSTKSCVRFLIRDSKNLASISSINVIFTDQLQDGRLYIVNPRYSQFGGCRSCYGRYYNNSDIIIALKDADGKKLTPAQLKAVALQAVGCVVGVKVNSDKNSIMYENTDFTKTTITDDDVQAVFNVYKPTRK